MHPKGRLTSGRLERRVDFVGAQLCAITETGLIRTGKSRHEKDDRHRLHDRARAGSSR